MVPSGETVQWKVQGGSPEGTPNRLLWCPATNQVVSSVNQAGAQIVAERSGPIHTRLYTELNTHSSMVQVTSPYCLQPMLVCLRGSHLKPYTELNCPSQQASTFCRCIRSLFSSSCHWLWFTSELTSCLSTWLL